MKSKYIEQKKRIKKNILREVQILNSIVTKIKRGSNIHPTQTFQIVNHFSEKKKKKFKFLFEGKKGDIWRLADGYWKLKFFQNQSIRFSFFNVFDIFQWLMANNWEKTALFLISDKLCSISLWNNYDFRLHQSKSGSKDRFQFIWPFTFQ